VRCKSHRSSRSWTTADNGATRVAPGSHRWDIERVPTADDFVPAEMAAGWASICLGATLR
jgi:ectoine hydroxylase-related dioxygenase (phytanoyl-CoA dioxygenase family)